jgi:hypothetical protein
VSWRQRWQASSNRVGNWLRGIARDPKRRRRAITLLAVVLLAYPVLGTLALWTGFVEWVIRDEDVKVEISNPAWTVFPGRIHLKSVKIYVNGDSQFILEGHDLFASISVLELMKHRVHVSRLASHHVRYQMRTQVKDPKASAKRIAAYPKLEGLPGVNTVSEGTAAATEKQEQEWTVQVEGLKIDVVELWFFEYRYLGEGHLRGGFTVGPNVMEVATAVQDIGPGELRFGEKDPLARQLRGQITCDIPRVNPNEHADASFLELVSARLNLRADVVSLKNVGAYKPDLEVSRGAGPLVFDLYMAKGYLGPKSKLTFQTDSVRVKGDGYGVLSDFKVDFDASGEHGMPLGKLDAKSTYFSLAHRDREFTIQIHGHHEEAALDTIRLGSATDLKRAQVSMPNIVSTDMRDLTVLFGDNSPIKSEAGEARASLHLDMDDKYWAEGPISAQVLRGKLNVAGTELSANTWLKTHVRFNPKLKTNMVQDLVLRLRNGSMGGAVNDWWADVSSPRITLWNGETPRVEGSVEIRTKNLAPALETLAKKDLISDIIPALTRLDDFRAKVAFRKQGALTDATIASESDIWDIAGRVYSNAKESLLAVVVGGQAVSLGVAKLGEGDLELRPFAKTDWLNARLAQFPKPLVQMAPSKP